jgi:hypothetical protein
LSLRWAFCCSGVDVRATVRRHRPLLEHLVDLGIGLLYGTVAAVGMAGLTLAVLAFCTSPPGP